MTSDLVLGLVFGIIFICFGVVIGGFSLPLAMGKVHARDYNGQLWQPKFLTTMPDKERDKMGQKNAKRMILFSVFIIAIGLGTILNGALSLINPMIFINIIIILLILIVPVAYGLMYLSWRKTHLANKNK